MGFYFSNRCACLSNLSYHLGLRFFCTSVRCCLPSFPLRFVALLVLSVCLWGLKSDTYIVVVGAMVYFLLWGLIYWLIWALVRCLYGLCCFRANLGLY